MPWWRRSGEAGKARLGSRAWLERGEAREILYLGRDGVEEGLHVRPTSSGANGEKGRWMDEERSSAGLFIARREGDEQERGLGDELVRAVGTHRLGWRFPVGGRRHGTNGGMARMLEASGGGGLGLGCLKATRGAP